MRARCRSLAIALMFGLIVGRAGAANAGVPKSKTALQNAPARKQGSTSLLPDLGGEWVCQAYCPAGGEGKTAHIVQDGRQLHLTNEGGGTSQGHFENDLGSLVADDWGNLKGAVDENGRFIRWTNGTVWTKVASSPALAKALKEAGKIDIYSILFDTDKTDIKPQSQSTLNEISKLLKSDPLLKLEVNGNTDNTGTAQHNMTLSRGRADSVVQALVKQYGISAARLQAKGYGDTKPVAPNDTEENRAKNRRVELRKF